RVSRTRLATVQAISDRSQSQNVAPQWTSTPPRLASAEARPCDQQVRNREPWSHFTRSFPGHIRNDKFLYRARSSAGNFVLAVSCRAVASSSHLAARGEQFSTA